ncbi:MAG: 2Fe-2S iron-sulfur cluster binding domain-containing protein [Propionibacteriales bacterium]|nr:2Fe-2S iron-sulfur cluster binding domain-containing protein [Propionibacteriales bacterium]
MTARIPRQDGRARNSAPSPRPAPTGLVAADSRVAVQLTVNGTPVDLHVPPRLTLADALRDRLGLTGTHLGCEHGVCGMCTVLVDGEAARACLLFACQLQDADVVTVEGLGRPDDLHPLQEAFSRRHGLQCGFCTPGFLLSAYDLLTLSPDTPEDKLPEELSGVLCRCTGYRGIVEAVADVSRACPDGIPGPGNCAPRTLLGRLPGNGVRTAAKDSPSSAPADEPDEIRLPPGEPTVAVEISTDVDASPRDVWNVLDDAPLVATCLPGAELTDTLGGDRYRGRARVSLGPVRLQFVGLAHVVERDADSRRLRVLAAGDDPGGGSVRADIRVCVDEDGWTSRITATADVFLAGRVAQFGRSLADDVSAVLFEQFSAALGDAASGTPGTARQQAPSALRMVLSALRRRLARVRRRITSHLTPRRSSER